MATQCIRWCIHVKRSSGANSGGMGAPPAGFDPGLIGPSMLKCPFFASTVAGNPLGEDDEKRKLELLVGLAEDVWGTK